MVREQRMLATEDDDDDNEGPHTPQPYNLKIGTVLLTRPIRKSINSSILLYNLLPIKKKRVTLQLQTDKNELSYAK